VFSIKCSRSLTLQNYNAKKSLAKISTAKKKTSGGLREEARIKAQDAGSLGKSEDDFI